MKAVVVVEDVAVAVVAIVDADVNLIGTVLPARRTFCILTCDHIGLTDNFEMSQRLRQKGPPRLGR